MDADSQDANAESTCPDVRPSSRSNRVSKRDRRLDMDRRRHHGVKRRSLVLWLTLDFMKPRSSRQALPDALRALAMVSVLVLNSIGYAQAPWGPVLGLRSPQTSNWDAGTQALVAAFLQGKGVSMLAFVFGMSLWLSARGHAPCEAQHRGLTRNHRLLRLGIGHGLFVYFGDILTMYALVGRSLISKLHMPWRKLRRHLGCALAWAVAAKLASLLILFAFPFVPWQPGDASLGNVQGAWQFFQLNASAYGIAQVSAIVFAAPVLYFCMACGIVAARLRLLTHRRWRPVMQRALLRCGPPLLGLSLLYGWGCARGDESDSLRWAIEGMGDLIAVPVAACYVGLLALGSAGGQARWCRWVSPLGRRTLTLYIGHSVVCLMLFSGAGLGIALSPVQIVPLCLVLWLVALVVATQSGTRQWPLEAWAGRT